MPIMKISNLCEKVSTVNPLKVKGKWRAGFVCICIISKIKYYVPSLEFEGSQFSV